MKKLQNDEFLRSSFAVLFQSNVKTYENEKYKMLDVFRQTPLDLLSLEWFDSEHRTIEVKAYLVGDILPQVVLGLEFILKEATQRNLITQELLDETNYNAGLDRNYNPINRLAEYLMRNNHKHHHFNESSPYVRGLRKAQVKLQHEILIQSEDQLAKLKKNADTLRASEKQKKLLSRVEDDKRATVISDVYNSLMLSNKNSVNILMVKDMVFTFKEFTSNLPDEIKQCMEQINGTQITGNYKTHYDKEQFVQYLMIYAKSMSADVFEQFLEHLQLCAVEFHKAQKREKRRKLLKNYFLAHDLDQLNELSSAQVFQLCEDYYSTSQQEIKDMIQDPINWATREYHNIPESSSKVDGKKNKQCKQDSPLNNNRSKLDGNIVQQDDNTSQQLGTLQLDKLTTRPVQFNHKDQLMKINQPAGSDGITQSQFVSIMEFIIPETAPLKLLSHCLTYLRRYKESTEEHDERKIQHFQKNAKIRKNRLLDKIFFTIDQECSGMLNLTKIESYILDYEDGFYEGHLKRAKSDLASKILKRESKQSIRSSTRTGLLTSRSTFKSSITPSSSKEFSDRSYLQDSPNQLHNLYYYYPEKSGEISIMDFKILLDYIFWPKNDKYLIGHDEFDFTCLEKFLNYLNEKLVQTMPNKIKTQIRREWIQKVVTVSQNVFDNSMESIYKIAFKTLIKDTIKHGEQKQISISIALLCSTTSETTSLNTNTQSSIQYVAAIPESEAERLVGQCPQKDELDLVIKCLNTGSTIIHLEKSSLRFSHMKNESHNASLYTELNLEKSDRLSSFGLVIPIPNAKKYFIGVMKVHNLSNNNQLLKFKEDEIQFYRGVVHQVGFAFSLINSRYLFSSMLQCAFDWIYERISNISQIIFYHRYNDDDDYEAEDGEDDHSIKQESMGEEMCSISSREINCKLCKLVSKRGIHKTTVHTDLQVINKRENYLYHYLFDVLESGYSLTSRVLNRQHYTLPFIDSNNKVVGVIDVCCLKKLKKYQLDYLHQSLVLIQEGYAQIVNYTGVYTYGQHYNQDEHKTTTSEKECELKSQAVQSNSDWMGKTDNFIPKLIVKKLIKMEACLLTSKIDENLFNNIKEYEIQLCSSEIHLIWTVILLLNPLQEYDTLNEENIFKLPHSTLNDIHKSILNYDLFTGEQQITSLRKAQLNEIYESKISYILIEYKD
ncbi:EF-hand calcium-binding domain-containing protein 5 [Schistosoma japonicum]|nr:EF-hand calcium-binding domain-containing protein 5 [Schistosoma japonicum]